MFHETIGREPWEWAGRTASEIRAIGEKDGSVLLVPVGSVEQHGDHLPVATDTILVDAVANRGAERAFVNVETEVEAEGAVESADGAKTETQIPLLLTPPVWTGYSPHHLSFGGTLTLSFEDVLAVLTDVVESGLENGFDAVVLLNGHGGNRPVIDAAVSTIGEATPETEVLGVTYFELAAPIAQEIRDSDLGGMAHAGEFETSLLLALRPDLVDEDTMEATYWDEPYEWGGRDLLAGGPLSVYRRFEEYSSSGAIGAPELASAEKGDRILEFVGDELASLLGEVHAQNRSEN